MWPKALASWQSVTAVSATQPTCAVAPVEPSVELSGVTGNATRVGGVGAGAGSGAGAGVGTATSTAAAATTTTTTTASAGTTVTAGSAGGGNLHCGGISTNVTVTEQVVVLHVYVAEALGKVG